MRIMMMNTMGMCMIVAGTESVSTRSPPSSYQDDCSTSACSLLTLSVIGHFTVRYVFGEKADPKILPKGGRSWEDVEHY